MSADIAPDINCPRCGPVIVCPHTMNYVKPNPTRPDFERTDNFLENMRRRNAAAAQEIPDEMWRYFGHTPPVTTSRTRPTNIAPPGKNPAYVAAAIRRELDHLAEATEGSRNDKLNRAAFSVFGFAKGGHADENAARTELERIASTIGLSHSEIQATLRSAWTSAVPREVPA